jgi:MFS transporter, AAHS family, 4-hydroxybenzoate transporter
VNELLNLDTLVDEQKFGRFNLTLLLWSFLAMMADGFDISALASAAPELARTWHIPAKTFGPAFSASLAGILFGAPLLGYVGDKFGRKTAIVSGCIIYGLTTLTTVWAVNLDQVVALRFITGIGIGGLMPNTIALNAELAPKRLRATLIVLMFTGITMGSGVPGYIQARLIPQYGWPIMFWIGGLAPLVIAAALILRLPESVKYLASRNDLRKELLATIRRLRSDLSIAEDAQFTVAPVSYPGSGIAQIFGGALAWLTPLLWVCFTTALMANYFISSWLPLILDGNGYTAKQSGIAISCYHYGGTLGGLLVSVVLARFGFLAIALLFLLAAPVIAAVGLPGISYIAMVSMVALGGFCTLGAQFGNNAASGLLYPTAFRSRGVGWALGVGRFGSIVGPMLGGILIGMKVSLPRLFLFAAVPMVIGFICSLGAARLSYTRLGGVQLDDVSQRIAGDIDIVDSHSPQK